MSTDNKTNDPRGEATDPDQVITRAVARLQARILALVFAAMGGLGLFAMTAWLVVKGGPHIGRHLQLLGHYFLGYSVTWKGAFIGLIYGGLTGGLVGWAIGIVYNRVAALRDR